MKPILLAALLPLVACASAPRAASDVQAELLEADRAFARASQDQGLPAWESWFAAESLVLPLGAPAVHGLSAVREAWRRDGFDPTHLRWTPTGARASEAGDLGYTWGTWELGLPDAPARRGAYMTVWRRQGDGRWKVETSLGRVDPRLRSLGYIAE